MYPFIEWVSVMSNPWIVTIFYLCLLVWFSRRRIWRRDEVVVCVISEVNLVEIFQKSTIKRFVDKYLFYPPLGCNRTNGSYLDHLYVHGGLVIACLFLLRMCAVLIVINPRDVGESGVVLVILENGNVTFLCLRYNLMTNKKFLAISSEV